MAFEVKRDNKKLASFKKESEAFAYLHKVQPHSVSHATTYEGYSIENKEKKKDSKKLFLEEVKDKDTISEKEVLLIKRRLNDGTYNSEEVYESLGEDGKKLTPEQQEKGKSWLMNKWKSPTGKERTNSPFGTREEEILSNVREIRIKEFHDAGSYGFKNYTPYYEVRSNDGDYFRYIVKGGEVSILE